MAGEAAAAAAEVEVALDHPPDPTAAAFFDVDNTIMQGASIFHLARGLHRRKFFTTRDIVGAMWKQAYFRVVGVENPEHVAETRNSALSFIAGHTVAELEELGEEIFDEGMAHRIWPGTRALAQLHLDEGQRVWLVTAAPIEIAQIIARRLGLTGAMGTVSEHLDGIYTGRSSATCCTGRQRPRRSRPWPPAKVSTSRVLRLLRLRQRPADARPGRRRVRHQPRRQAPRPREGPALAGPRLPHRPQGRPGRPARRRGARPPVRRVAGGSHYAAAADPPPHSRRQPAGRSTPTFIH